MVLAIFGRIGAKIGLKSAGRTAAKTVVKTTMRSSLARIGLGAGIGGLGALSLSSFFNSDGGFLNMINPLNGGSSLILFLGIVGVILFVVMKFRKR